MTAILTGEVNPIEVNVCLKVCFIAFLIQVGMQLGFIYEYKDFKKFQPFEPMTSSLRVISSILLHLGVFREF